MQQEGDTKENQTDRDDFSSENYYQIQRPQSLTRGQKLAVAALSVIAFFILAMWAVQFRRTLAGGGQISNNQNTNKSTDQDTAYQESLKTKDTDHDSLSDWDELNIYKTSPYLADSDSDGIPDGVEVKNHTDPLCPEGHDCYGTGADGGQGSTTPSVDTNQTTDNSQASGANNSTTTSQISGANATDVLSGKVDGPTLRKMLVERGMPADMLSKFTDEQLLANFQEILKQKK